jgi:hypothetical protein
VVTETAAGNTYSLVKGDTTKVRCKAKANARQIDHANATYGTPAFWVLAVNDTTRPPPALVSSFQPSLETGSRMVKNPYGAIN